MYSNQERQQGGESYFKMDTPATDRCEISMSLNHVLSQRFPMDNLYDVP